MTKTMTENYEFERWSPEELYNLIIDSRLISELTDYETNFGKKTGENLSAVNGGVTGKVIYTDTGKMIAFSWRWLTRKKSLTDSILALVFMPHEKGTRVEISSINIPDDETSFMDRDRYWEPIKQYIDHETEERKQKEEEAAHEAEHTEEEPAEV